jgi:ADP-heptose:LPS heptosyltransferase
VILFGPETPVLYGQTEITEKREIIASNFVCSPCVNVYNQRKSPCKTGMCLRSIKAEQVYEKVKSLLKR